MTKLADFLISHFLSKGNVIYLSVMISLKDFLVKLDFRRIILKRMKKVMGRRHWKRSSLCVYATLESFAKFVLGTDWIQNFTKDFATKSRKVSIKQR